MSTLVYADAPAKIVMDQKAKPWESFFRPKAVAIVGASERPGSVGRTLLWNLISSSFGGTVFPVNISRSSVLGIHAYSNVAAIPAAVDLAVVATPAGAVLDVVRECADAEVKAV